VAIKPAGSVLFTPRPLAVITDPLRIDTVYRLRDWNSIPEVLRIL
jgi:hypothetical protein